MVTEMILWSAAMTALARVVREVEVFRGWRR
jgi:hypothetical protein